MRRRLLLAGFAVMGAAWAALVACVGEDPVPLDSTDSNDAGSEGSTANSPNDAAGVVADGADDAPTNTSACGERDTTPCGCGAGKSCCVGGASLGCYPVGNEDEDAAAGCTSTSTLRCIGTTCGANRACCFNGEVMAGNVCGKRLAAFDTACVTIDPDAGDPYPCIDTTNGSRKAITCIVDGDCARFDAGTCVSGLMDKVQRVIGVCSR